MTAACELLAVEHRLDRVDAILAAELPAHLRALARSYARRTPAPPAPDVLRRPATIATARAALLHAELADRGLALLRLAAPLAIERDVALAYAMPATWVTLSALAAARDRAAQARFGRRAIPLLHALHGAAHAADPPPALPPAIPAWTQPDGIAVDDAAILAVWHALRAQHGVPGALHIERAAVRPRCFVVEPGREAIAVLPAVIATPAERFATLHELGHALVALGLPAGTPRALDEAAASHVARAMEGAHPWHSPLAAAARHRRTALARRLDQLERQLPDVGDPPTEKPPWALWHDPGAQAAYVAAEALADAFAAALADAADGARALLPVLRAHRARLDSVAV